MDDIKLSVTVVLPGNTMMTSQECEQNPQENYTTNFTPLFVKRLDRKTKKPYFKKEILEFKTRKCKDAQQVLRMNSDAYDNMVSTNCPDWYIPKGGISKWKKLSKEQKLLEHLTRICESFGGKSFTYNVFSD